MTEDKEHSGKKSEWLDEWPTEEGDYWFYGNLFGVNSGPSFHQVVHRVGGDGKFVTVCDGEIFLFESEQREHGIWHKIEYPQIPPEYQNAFGKTT